MTPLLWFLAYFVFGFFSVSLLVRYSDYLDGTYSATSGLNFFALWLLWPMAFAIVLLATTAGAMDKLLTKWVEFLVRQ